VAEEHFERALRLTATIGARPYQGHSHFYCGSFLLKRGDSPRARTHLTRARAIYDALEMSYPAAKTVELLETIGEASFTPGEAVLRRDGDIWTLGFAESTFLLKDIKGLHYLIRLIANPDREISALDLAAGSAEARPSGWSGELSVGTLDPGLDVIDDAARRAYTARIKDLQEEIDDAHDPGLRSNLQEEMDALVGALTGAIGRGGRTRKTSSAAEKARLSVTRAIRSAIERIEEKDRVLGKHLSVSVRTGTFCSYSPDAASEIRWRL
jgi:hypothetical protein